MIVWDSNRVEEGLAVITPCRTPLLQHVKELLDNYHGTSRSIEYYDVLLGDWVEQLLQLAYFAFSEVSEQSSKLRCGQELIISVPVDSRAFTLGAIDHPELTEGLEYVVYHLMNGIELSQIKFRDSDVQHSKRGIKARLLTEALESVSPKEPEILICSPYVKCSKAEWISALIRWRRRVRWDDLDYPIRWDSPSDHSWRLSQVSGHGGNLSFLEIAKALSGLYLPKIYLEGFSTFREQVLALGVSRPKIVYSANALYWHTTFKTLVSEWREHGTQLLYHQHGGGYGIDKQNVCEDYEVRVADRYYNWGWSHPSSKVVALSSPQLSFSKRRGAHYRWEVLLVCLETPKIPYRLWYQPMPGTMELVNEETVAFVSRLNNPADLLVRPGSQNFGWGLKDMIVNRVPNTLFDDFSVNSFKRFSESRVVVHNYLGTSWLETLALNIPTICFFPPGMHAFRQEAGKFIEDFEDVGILHSSGKEAAAFIQSIGQGVDAWWNSQEVQEARLAFVAKYANFSSNWVSSWEAEFDSLL